MTAAAAGALAVAMAASVADWVAVARGARRWEYAAKPLAMTGLIAVAALVDPAFADRRAWFVAAGVCSLAGDVFLMLPRDRFVAGLVAFLAAHVCYVAGLVQVQASAPAAAVGAVVVLVMIATVGRRVLSAVHAAHPRLLAPVIAYLVVISAMVVAAFATGPPLAAVGAATFYASDGILAEQRFVQPRRWAPVAVMITYHLGQAALILSLLAG